MDQFVINDLHACINCLGSLDGKNFVKDIDTNVSIRDILRHLRRESNKCEIRLELSDMNVIKQCLIPLLKCSIDDGILYDLLIRLLMNLTQPAFICFKQQLPDDLIMRGLYIKVNESLQRYKLLFADKEVFKILSDSLIIVFDKQWESRSEEEHMMVERVLILVRNILHINTNDTEAIDGTWSHHDRVLSAMLDSGWTELLVYLSNTEDEHRFAFHTLEIVSLMFKEQNGETMTMKIQNSNGSKEHDNENLIRLVDQENERRLKESESVNVRALRYDGFFELPKVKSSSGLPMVYHHDISTGKLDLTRDRRLRRKPRNYQKVVETITQRKSAKPILEKLQEFCRLFLEHGYSNLMMTARNYLVRQQTQADDETYYLWALKFFTSVCRLGLLTPEFVSETVNHEVFHWVYEQVIQYKELAETNKKIARSFYRKLQLAVSAYNELLRFLVWLDHHTDKKYRELSVHIKSSVFYREEYMDLFPMLLHRFKESLQSRILLRELIEGSYLVIRILENHKSFNMNVVRKLKRKRKAPKKKTVKVTLEGVENVEVVMPGDDKEELMRVWDRIKDVVTAAVNGQAELSDEHKLPCIYDPTLPDLREPIEPGSEPVNIQLKKALGIVQVYLRQERALEAVALLRLARTMWYDEDRIALSEFEDTESTEIEMLKTLLLAPAFYAEEDLKAVKKDVVEEEEEPTEDIFDEEAEYEDNEYMEEEVLFDLNQFLLKFIDPAIVKTYGLLFNEITENPAITNCSLLYIMHRIAVKMKLPVVFYQLRLFRAFSKFLKCSLSLTQQYKEVRKFVFFMVNQFRKDATVNRKLFVEILFQKNPRHLTNILTGDRIVTETKTEGWSDELDEELERLCEDVRVEDPLPGVDKVTMIMDRFSDPSKTRRQIVCRLTILGLNDSMGDLMTKRRKKPKNENAWSGEEQARLIVLVDESKDEKSPIKFIMNGMKVAVEDPSKARSRREVVRRILELGLVPDKAALGIKERVKKRKGGQESEEEESGEETDQGGNEEEEYEEGPREKRLPPPMKIRKMVDWTAFKMTFARLDRNDRNWFVELLVDNIDSRNHGIIGTLALIPLMDEDSSSLSSPTMQKLLGICNFHHPDVSNNEHFWRIPEDMGAKELEYFRNCATSLTESELRALVMTEENSQPKEIAKPVKATVKEKTLNFRDLLGSDSDDNPDEDGDEEEVNIRPKQKRRFMDSDDEENDNVNSSVVEEKSKSKPKKTRRVLDSDDEEIDNGEEASGRQKKIRRLLDSDEEENDNVNSSIVEDNQEESEIKMKMTRRLIDSGEEDNDDMNISMVEEKTRRSPKKAGALLDSDEEENVNISIVGDNAEDGKQASSVIERGERMNGNTSIIEEGGSLVSEGRTGLLFESDDESEGGAKRTMRESVGLFESDDDGDEALASMKNKRRILDSDDEEDEPPRRKKRVIEDDSD